jgi:hypothetical protein
VLHYSEHAAFNRIEVARAAGRWPQLLACLEDGSLHLAGARLLAPHLTAENIDMALEAARHKSKREIEEVAAGLAHRALLVAVAAEEYRLHLTISRATRDKLRQVQALLSHQLPDGNPAVILDRALELLLKVLERQRAGATDRPRKARPRKRRSRYVAAAVRREVWARDEAQCAFIGPHGRCKERKFLEFHHRDPYAEGGGSTAVNIELRCRAHNVYEAELHFGPEVVAAARARRQAAKRGASADTACKGNEVRGAVEPVGSLGSAPTAGHRKPGSLEGPTLKRRRSTSAGPTEGPGAENQTEISPGGGKRPDSSRGDNVGAGRQRSKR